MTAFFNPPEVDVPTPVPPREVGVQDEFGKKKKKRRSGLAQLIGDPGIGDWGLNSSDSTLG